MLQFCLYLLNKCLGLNSYEILALIHIFFLTLDYLNLLSCLTFSLLTQCYFLPFCVSGNIVALLHSFFSNLPHEWLESTHTIIKHLRPLNSVAMLRIAFRIMGPLLPRLAFARPLFMKVHIELFVCTFVNICITIFVLKVVFFIKSTRDHIGIPY